MTYSQLKPIDFNYDKFISKKEVIELLNIDEKQFSNYYKNSKEIPAYKYKNRFYFLKSEIEFWDKLKQNRTVLLTIEEYKECFEFAVKMAYSTNASHGTGIRGTRSEVQMADDFILGILAEFGVRNFLKNKFNTCIKLDTVVHPDHITAQDFVAILDEEGYRPPKIGIAVKSSKWKSCFNVIPAIEYENTDRQSDIYIFARVGLPSDHLFRLFKTNKWFDNINDYLDSTKGFKRIQPISEIPVWITGFNYHNEFHKVTEIPGQKFSGNPDYRYAVSVSEMHNDNKSWEALLSIL